jgi:DNA polymerase-3 subunit alpha
MEIVQKLAGFSLSQADNVRRYMSKKKTEKLEHERKNFIYGNEEMKIEGCLARGINEEVANKLFDQMIDFAKYAFNKSHAAAYAVLSYITAYLKYHYPIEYMCAMLNCSPLNKIAPILNDCRDFGIEVIPPKLNLSDIGFTIYNDKILFGLDSIKGTKIASVTKIMNDRKENGEYASFKEFLRRNVADKSTTENMIKAGAMDEFNPNRHALMNNYSTSSTIASKISAKEAEIESLQELLNKNPEDAKVLKKLTTAKEAVSLLNKQFDVIRIVDTPEDLKMRLKAEKEVLGVFVSAHPMDQYRTSEELGCVPISDLTETGDNVSIVGLIEGLEIKARKSDGKPMAFFNLEDKTGTIEICCFTKAYEKFGDLLEEDAIVELNGKVNEKEAISGSVDEEDISEGENVEVKEVYLNFFVEKVKLMKPDLNDIRLTINSMLEWNETLIKLRKAGYLCDSGHPLTIYDRLNGEFRRTYCYIKEDILTDETYITAQYA